MGGGEGESSHSHLSPGSYLGNPFFCPRERIVSLQAIQTTSGEFSYKNHFSSFICLTSLFNKSCFLNRRWRFHGYPGHVTIGGFTVFVVFVQSVVTIDVWKSGWRLTNGGTGWSLGRWRVRHWSWMPCEKKKWGNRALMLIKVYKYSIFEKYERANTSKILI